MSTLAEGPGSPDDRQGAGGPASSLEKWELVVYGLVLAWFIARVTWLALRLHPMVPPDEVTHMGRVLAYAKAWGVPADGPASLEYGLIGHRPWLYYWLMARLVSLNVFPLPDVVFLRLVNGALGTGTILVGLAWVREWCRLPLARVLFAFLVANTLMFTGLAASVSYDNLANLLAASALLAFTRFRRSSSPAALGCFLALVFAGALAKRTLLPLGFLLVCWLAFRERGRLAALPRALAEWLRGPSRAGVAAVALAALLGILAASLYGGNLLRYGQLVPGFEQVVGVEDAMQNRIFARSHILDEFRAGRISYARAQEMAGSIRHMGDRGDTLFLLKTSRLPESSLVGRVGYASEWMQRMLKGANSYIGHRRAQKSHEAMYGYFAIFGLAALLALRGWRRGSAGGAVADAAVLAFGYSMILMWLVNYPDYVTSKYIELGLQARYLFPVLLPIYGLVAFFLVEGLPPRLRPWVVVAVGAFYSFGDLPWLWPRTDARWWMPEGL